MRIWQLRRAAFSPAVQYDVLAVDGNETGVSLSFWLTSGVAQYRAGTLLKAVIPYG